MTDDPRRTSAACPSHPDLARAAYRTEASLTMLGTEMREQGRAQASEMKEMRQDVREVVAKIDGVVSATGKIDKLLVEHLAEHRGRDQGKAEMSGEITVAVGRGAKIAKWVLGAIMALAAGGGATEAIRRLVGG